jgi:hypothetical protein
MFNDDELNGSFNKAQSFWNNFNRQNLIVSYQNFGKMTFFFFKKNFKI